MPLANTIRCAFILVLILLIPGAVTGSPIPLTNCPAGTIDVLDWMTVDSNDSKHMTGSHTLYSYYNTASPFTGKFIWVKNQFNWDVQTFDSQFIYHWITEIDGWSSDGRSFKKHVAPMKMAQRCTPTGYPGYFVTTSSSGANYRRTINCAQQPVQGIGYVVWELWGPYTAACPGLPGECSGPNPLRTPIGGSVGNSVQVYTLAYRYGCDSAYTVCDSKEEFILAKEFGLVRWHAWRWDQCPGQPPGFKCYVSNQVSNFNIRVTSPTISPTMPCSGTLQ